MGIYWPTCVLIYRSSLEISSFKYKQTTILDKNTKFLLKNGKLCMYNIIDNAWLPQAFSVSLYHTVFSREMIWITALERHEWRSFYLDCTRTTQSWCGDSIFLWILCSLMQGWTCSFLGIKPANGTLLEGYSININNIVFIFVWFGQWDTH